METPVNDTASNNETIADAVVGLDTSTPLDTPVGDEVPSDDGTAADGEVLSADLEGIQSMSHEELVAGYLSLRKEVLDLANSLAQLTMGIGQMHQSNQMQLGNLAQGLDTYQTTISQLATDVAEFTGKPNALFKQIVVVLTDGPLNNNSVKLTLHSDSHPTHPNKIEAFNLNATDPDKNNWHWVPTELKPELVDMTIAQFELMGRERDKFCCATFQLGAAPQLPPVPEAANDEVATPTADVADPQSDPAAQNSAMPATDAAPTA